MRNTDTDHRPAARARAKDPDGFPMLTAFLCFGALVVMHFGGWLP